MGPPWGEIWLGNFALQNKKNKTGHRAVTDDGGEGVYPAESPFTPEMRKLSGGLQTLQTES